MEIRISEDTPWYAECEFGSLDDFRIWLSKFGINGERCPLDDCIFRGIGKANKYKLIPSAFRDTTINYLYNNGRKRLTILNYHNSQEVLFGHEKPSDMAVVSAELAELFRFYKESNLQGLNLPEVEYFKEKMYVQYHEEYLKTLDRWPDTSMLELMALAQHYGLPTRLLDWTSNINVALYFALRSVVKRIYENKITGMGEPFCIWSVRASYIQDIFEDYHGVECPIKFYVPQYSNNPNLHAQEGILSYQSVALSQKSYSSDFCARPVNEVLMEYYSDFQTKHANIKNDGVMLCKMVFKSEQPVSEFEYITKHGYNAARLFPGYKGVIKKMEEDEMIRVLNHYHQ